MDEREEIRDHAKNLAAGDLRLGLNGTGAEDQFATLRRQCHELRDEPTRAKIAHHAKAVDELDVLASADRILPRLRPVRAGIARP